MVFAFTISLTSLHAFIALFLLASLAWMCVCCAMRIEKVPNAGELQYSDSERSPRDGPAHKPTKQHGPGPYLFRKFTGPIEIFAKNMLGFMVIISRRLICQPPDKPFQIVTDWPIGLY